MAVILNSENKVLIGSSPRDSGYKFPQGGIDTGETNFEALKRELMEELGLELNYSDVLEECKDKVTYFYAKSNPNGFDGQEQVVFKIRYRKDMNLIPQDNEFGELVWINPEELENYDCKHRINAYKKALELCGLL